MTPSERKALLFLAAVGTLGAGARLVATPRPGDTPASRVALARQLDAVDSARAAGAERERGRRPRASRGGRVARAGARSSSPEAPAPLATPPARVDVDVADTDALEALPGVGPALARRIVEARARDGPFGSVAALERVRGVGPKLAERLAPHVTFSGVPRPTSAAARRPP